MRPQTADHRPQTTLRQAQGKQDTSDKTKELEKKDKRFLWHPFTQMKDWQSEEITVIESAKGVYLKDTEGREYLDGVSSLWCNVHGHQVPELDEAIKDQLGKVAHSTFLGMSNIPGIELAEKLVQISPKELSRVFYSDSGSEAVEIALKMAYQYWQQKGKKKKTKFARLTNAYHGDTLGSVSVGGIELFHEVYQPLLFETFSIPSPYIYRWKTGQDPEQVARESLEAMEKVISENHEQMAAFVMEPLMQGAAGMIDQPKGYISRAREITKRYNVLLIFDEVATGFGRTGKMFASDHENVCPDIMAVAKGLTGGYLPLAATLATEEIYEGFLGEYEECKTFFHGHTFTANPLACKVAIANLDLFEKNQVLKSCQNKIKIMTEKLKAFYDLSIVGDIRQVGMMAGVELVRNKKTREAFDWKTKIGIRVIQEAKKRGAILRPLGSVIVLMPPLAMSEGELTELLDITYESIKSVEETLNNQ